MARPPRSAPHPTFPHIPVRGRSPFAGALASLASLAVLTALGAAAPLPAALLVLPTANQALFEPDGAPRFFAPTPGRDWAAGQFGCVRSEGWQMHEGIDILALERDRHGEPLDEVVASADGEVAYVSRKAGLSNYGIYVVLRHHHEGLEFYTLYAHLRDARPDLDPGRPVRQGERLGRMGRTANTASSIARERAHVHFEIALLVHDEFPRWLQQHYPDALDHHGNFNGRNLLGLDPAEILLAQREQGPRFSLLRHVRNRDEMFRVLLARTSFPWLHRYPILIRRNPVAENQGIVAYEASFDMNGIPFRLVPRSRAELQGQVATRLLAVQEDVYRRHPCRKLVVRRGQVWSLTAAGQELIDLLTH